MDALIVVLIALSRAQSERFIITCKEPQKTISMIERSANLIKMSQVNFQIE